jgi:hypothetical protein
MSGPFLCYREIIPPTSVDAAKFFSREGYGDFLITLTSSAINIYRVNFPGSDKGTGAFFSLVLHSKLFGKPCDVNTFSSSSFETRRNGEKGGENWRSNEMETYIVLNFDAGKISISRFDPLKSSLEPVSLFNAEEEAIGAGAEIHALTQGRKISPGVGNTPYLAMDREGSIACTLLYGQQFLFVSLLSSVDTLSSDTLDSMQRSSVSKETASKQFIVDIQLSLRLLGPVLDYCFLPGYSRPTLAVLQESGPLPVGHTASTRHVCSLSVLAVDNVAKSVSVLWRQMKLPCDSICILSLSHPSLCGSVALVTLNAVLIVSQEAVSGIATCGFAGTTVSSHIKLQPSKLSEGLELDASRWIEADDQTLIGSLKDGSLFSVHLIPSVESLNQDIRFDCKLMASSIKCSCFCKSESSNLWFLGSRLSDCILIEASMNLEAGSGSGLGPSGSVGKQFLQWQSPGGLGGVGTPGVTPAAKRVRRFSIGSGDGTPYTPYTPYSAG